MTKRIRDCRGGAMVEAPIAIIVMVAIALAAFWVGNIVMRHHQAEEAVHSGARYGSRAYYAPNSTGRRRSEAEIRAHVVEAAKPLENVTVDVLCGTAPDAMAPCTTPVENQPPGSFIEVRASTVVGGSDPILDTTQTVNSLFEMLTGGRPLPETVTVTESAVAAVE